MENMNNEVMENTVTEIVEGATEKLTFKDNVAAYGIATIFATGVVTIGYLGFKGAKAIASRIKEKRNLKEESDEGVIDVEDGDIREDIDETEQE
jgi:hypothetical protein